MQDNLKKKWDVTSEELKAAEDELCAKGVGKGCYQNMNALLALLDVMTAGDIPAQAENGESKSERKFTIIAPDEVKEDAKLFFEMVQKSKEEIAQMFNSGMFNSIAVGYGKIALEAMGLTGKAIVAFEKEMKRAFDMYDAEEALKAYNRTEGGKQ